MKVHLHLTDTGEAVFHAERPTAAREPHPPHSVVRGWIERRAAHLKEAWSHAKHGATGKARAFWERLHQRMPSDESMLIHPRSASSIEVLHPGVLSSEEAESLWSSYLSRCRRRHLPWLIINVLLAPISVVLAPVPGPNLIGYWFLYRAVRDVLVLMGIRHARTARVATTYQPAEGLGALTGTSCGWVGEHSQSSGFWTGEAHFAAMGRDPHDAV